jgi:hypothetical protein
MPVKYQTFDLKSADGIKAAERAQANGWQAGTHYPGSDKLQMFKHVPHKPKKKKP